MDRIKIVLMAMVFVLSGVSTGFSAEDPSSIVGKLNWIKGPNKASIGPMAEITLARGFVALDGSDTRRLLEAMQNLTSGEELALVGTEDLNYFAVYAFDDIGYVKDDEKSSIDADAILAQIKKNNIAANEEKKKKGWQTMDVVGWAFPPRYNSQTHNLEWAVKFKADDGQEVVNYNTKYLGRRGVMRVILVCDPAKLEPTINEFQNVMTTFSFIKGNSYSEFTQGDKVAKYGLSALIVGGAAAAAAKSGLFKYLGKFIFAVGIAVIAFAKSIFEKLTGLFRGKPSN
jgi:uncharacterized membrane-anchored protein